MKYLKKFETHADYESYMGGGVIFLPNVSICDDDAADVVHYNPLISHGSIWYKIENNILYLRANETDGYNKRVLYTDSTLAKNGWYNAPNKAQITKTVIEEPIYPTSCRMFFDGMSAMSEIDNFTYLHMDSCEDCRLMFQNCSSLTSLNVSAWNVSKVKDMAAVFNNCSSLTSVGNLSNWDVSSATTIGGMFQLCGELLSVGDLSNWDVSNVTAMNSMFNMCSNLSSIGDLSNWNVGNVTNMGKMFQECESLSSIGDLSNWDVSNATNMSYAFRVCSNLSSIGDLSNWNVSNVTDMDSMFANTKYVNPNLPESVKVLGPEQYINNCAIESLYFDSNLEKIGKDGLQVTFNDCVPSLLNAITISNDNMKFKSINDEIVLSKDGTYLYCDANYGIGQKYETFNVPEGVSHLISGAFRNLGYKETEEDKQEIKEMCGRDIYDPILRNIVFPSTLAWIGDRVCEYAHSIESLTVEATTPPTIYGDFFFYEHAPNFAIYVPSEAVEAYKSASGWSNFASIIQAIPE